MEAVKSLEKTLVDIYKNAPHLPAGGREWLANNVWWLALIGAVLSAIGLLTIVPLMFAIMGIGAALGDPIYNIYTAGAPFGLYWLTAFIAVINIAASAVLLGMAVKPLKAKMKKGWTLLFLSLLVSVVLNVVSDLVIFDIVAAIFAVIWAGIGGYFLFEIHSYFEKTHTKKPVKK